MARSRPRIPHPACSATNAYKAEVGGTMTGTFDLTFPNSETGKGSFDADFCDASVTGTCT
jgi:hypothetical protein